MRLQALQKRLGSTKKYSRITIDINENFSDKSNENLDKKLFAGGVMYMKYISTRNNCEPVDAAAAIAQGMVPDGGLFVPQNIPVLDAKDIAAMAGKSYQEIAKWDFSSIFE